MSARRATTTRGVLCGCPRTSTGPTPRKSRSCCRTIPTTSIGSRRSSSTFATPRQSSGRSRAIPRPQQSSSFPRTPLKCSSVEESTPCLHSNDRTGNVLTTVALFAAIAAVVYAARATLVVFVLALLLAYLLEPLVAWVQGRLPARSGSRHAAIAVVYAFGTLLVAGAGYALGPAVAAQLQQWNASLPGAL